MFASRDRQRGKLAPAVGSVPLRGLIPFPGRPFGIHSSRRVGGLIRDISRGKILIPTVIHRGSGNSCRVVSKREQGFTDRVTNGDALHYVISGLSSSTTAIVVISDGVRERGVLPDRGTFTCGVGLSTVGERNGEGSLASARIIPGLEDGRGFTRRMKRDERAVEQCVHLACLVPRLLRVISRNGVGVLPTIRVSFLSGRCRRSLLRTVRDRYYAPSRTRTVHVRGVFGSKRLGDSAVLRIVYRLGPGRRRELVVPRGALRGCVPGSITPRGERSCMYGTLRRCGGFLGDETRESDE